MNGDAYNHADGSSQAAKRYKSQRSLGHSDPARQHPDFWYQDGSVVIEIDLTRFCLHQSTLQKHSAYFSALFRGKGKSKSDGRAYHELEGGEPSQNGHIPVYHVCETTADDFVALLTVIEQPIKYAEEVPPLSILAGVLRSAGALSFTAQRKWAERTFERMWPAAFDTLTDEVIPNASTALTLARTCGVRNVQKRASYELLRMPTFGQSIATVLDTVQVGRRGRADATDLEALPHADLLRLVHAREQLCLAWAEAAGKAPTDLACPRGTQTQTSTERGSCASMDVDRMHSRWAELVHTNGLFAQWMADPLMGLQKLVDIPWKDEGFCKRCVSARRNEWEELRRKLWNNLDVWLELPTAADSE
ncbi:hypothetical protein B0F90DRAFT_1740938 [Multifurca ochricompacta]|uniref:BTB domain-containing protein n=1 Tax=Multifurca ochricompacta TaxID=376703 RepID=A0AAD4QLU1_9AGAM|nr:hypothetical protein B0F90DRAFT_1740938 [Multifurca ochricompacta]